MTTKAENAKLINHVNSLCEYVQKHLAEGWEIHLLMGKDECSIEVFNHDGCEVEIEHDAGYSSIQAACELSHEMEFSDSQFLFL